MGARCTVEGAPTVSPSETCPKVDEDKKIALPDQQQQQQQQQQQPEVAVTNGNHHALPPLPLDTADEATPSPTSQITVLTPVPEHTETKTVVEELEPIDINMESSVISMSQLKLTKPAPDWHGKAVVDGDFKEIALSQYKGKYLVFFFYPLDFTFVCPTEIIAFSERAEEFRSIGCEIVACSTDSHFSHLAWVNTPRKQGGLGEMKIPLLADKTCEIAKAYGVFKEDEGIAFRGLFIIDDKGNLRQITINDLPVGRSVDESLRLVQAFQYTDKHGEVCPAGWRPGKATMVPDAKKSKTYFSENN